MENLKPQRPGSGCLYLFGIGAIAIVLFCVNMLIVQSLTDTIPIARQQQVKQFILLVFPLAMILAEFWFFDFITDLLDRRID